MSSIEQTGTSDSPTVAFARWKVAVAVWAAIAMAPMILLVSLIIAVTAIPLLPLWMALFGASARRPGATSSPKPPPLAHGPLMGHAAAGAAG